MACKVKVNRHGFLAFRFYWNGREFWQGTGWRDTPKNRIKAEGKALEITEEIKAKTFSYLKWFPNGNKANEFKPKVETKPDEKSLTVREYYDQWIKDKTPPIVKKSRARNYRSHFSVHILPLHGDVLLSEYGVTHIRDLRLHLIEEKKISLKTAKNVIGASLKALYRDAKAFGKIDKNPFLDLPREWWPRVVTPEPDPFTETERDNIIEYFFKKYWQSWPQGFVFLYALFWGGQRPSELTARRWRDIDLNTGMVSITTSRTEGEEGAPKTANSRRTIQLLRPVAEYLAQIKPLRAQPDDYIFTDQRGEPINQWKFSELFQGALTVLKIRHRDFYHTRHTFISVMLTHGENPKRIAEYVGNSPEVIYRNYGKWLGDSSGFGNTALLAAKNLPKPKPLPKPYEIPEVQPEPNQVVGVVRGAGFETTCSKNTEASEQAEVANLLKQKGSR